ncbi:hypothetical protein D3C78_1404150 [compost metagenome]
MVHPLRVQQARIGLDHPFDDARTDRRGHTQLLAQAFEGAHLFFIHTFIGDEVAQVELALFIFQLAFERRVDLARTRHYDGFGPGLAEARQRIALAGVPEQLATQLQATLQPRRALDAQLLGLQAAGEQGLAGQHAAGDHRHHSGDQQSTDDRHAALLRRKGRIRLHNAPYK